MGYLLPFWNYRISAGLTLLTGIRVLWQYPGAKGTAGHITRSALALLLSVFVVYMNTATVLNQPLATITNAWRIRLLAFPKCGLGLLWFDGSDAGVGWISDARDEAPMAKRNGFARHPQIRRLRSRNILARFKYRERNRLADTLHLKRPPLFGLLAPSATAYLRCRSQWIESNT
jgi:hypothetical protein